MISPTARRCLRGSSGREDLHWLNIRGTLWQSRSSAPARSIGELQIDPTRDFRTTESQFRVEPDDEWAGVCEREQVSTRVGAQHDVEPFAVEIDGEDTVRAGSKATKPTFASSTRPDFRNDLIAAETRVEHSAELCRLRKSAGFDRLSAAAAVVPIAGNQHGSEPTPVDADALDIGTPCAKGGGVRHDVGGIDQSTVVAKGGVIAAGDR